VWCAHVSVLPLIACVVVLPLWWPARHLQMRDALWSGLVGVLTTLLVMSYMREAPPSPAAHSHSHAHAHHRHSHRHAERLPSAAAVPASDGSAAPESTSEPPVLTRAPSLKATDSESQKHRSRMVCPAAPGFHLGRTVY
jgi:hypothetical protein